MLYTYRTEEAFAADSFGLALRERRGDEFTILDNAAIGALDGVLADRFRHALHRSTARFTPDPRMFCETLADQFVQAGGVLRQATVHGFVRSDGRVRTVSTSGGLIATDDVVIGPAPGPAPWFASSGSGFRCAPSVARASICRIPA